MAMNRKKRKLTLNRETLHHLASLDEAETREVAGGVVCSKCATTCATCVNCASYRCGGTAQCSVGTCANSA
jgi:hypothetical protein